MAWIKSWKTQFLLAIIVVSTIVATYCYRIVEIPCTDNDEVMLLSIPYRVVTYGDSDYRVLGSTQYEEGKYRRLTPFLPGVIRNQLHRLLPFSDQNTRKISAFFVLSSVFLSALGTAVWLRSTTVFLPVFLLLSLHPSVYYAARTMRGEQEIVFCGMLATLGLTLLHTPKRKLLNVTIWMARGALAGLAACEHPWGCIFAIAILICLCIDKSAWRSTIALPRCVSVAAFLIGALIPVLFVVYEIATDFSGYLLRWQYTAEFYRTVTEVSTKVYGAFFSNSVLSNVLPERLSGQINTMLLGACFRPVGIELTLIHRLIFLLALLVVLTFTGLKLRKIRSYPPQLQLPLILTFVTLLFHFSYRPSENYYLYSVLAVMVAFSTVLVYLGWNQDRQYKLARRALFGLAVIYMLSFPIYFRELEQVTIPTSLNCNLDQLLTAQKNIVELLNWKNCTGKIFIDSVTWPSGNASSASAMDTLYFPETSVRRGPNDLVVFDLVEANGILGAPNFGTKQFSSAMKAEKLRNFVEGLAPAAILLYPNRQIVYFQPNKPESNKLILGQVTSAGYKVARLLKAKGCFNAENGAFTDISLPCGSYVLRVESRSQNAFDMKVTAASENNTASISVNVPAIASIVPYFIEVPKPKFGDSKNMKITLETTNLNSIDQLSIFKKTAQTGLVGDI